MKKWKKIAMITSIAVLTPFAAYGIFRVVVEAVMLYAIASDGPKQDAEYNVKCEQDANLDYMVSVINDNEKVNVSFHYNSGMPHANRKCVESGFLSWAKESTAFVQECDFKSNKEKDFPKHLWYKDYVSILLPFDRFTLYVYPDCKDELLISLREVDDFDYPKKWGYCMKEFKMDQKTSDSIFSIIEESLGDLSSFHS